MKIIKFGEDVKDYSFPVLNEREIRAAAGIIFLFMFLSFLLCVLTGNFVMLKYVITIFLADLIIRVFINPKYAPTLILGRFIVQNQVPEYVGAKQKKFAWIIGVFLGTPVLVFQVLLNAKSPITGITCMICMMFLFFESAFGICLGCKFYPLFFKDKAEFCAGEICDKKSKQEIQRISKAQVIALLAFIILVILMAYFANEFYLQKPYDLFGVYEDK
ncbi:MAG: DUF4395 domain-containing protein [Spirochaetia bacterium]|nr:DUF4395 domain-containing protein [Spirochaetia bacterium]